MNEIPDFWRTEIWHPLSVHMPLALLIVGTALKLIQLAYKDQRIAGAGNILLILGTLGAWIAIYTGNMADGAVSRKICDPTVLKDHQNGAYIVAWLYTVASGLVMIHLAGWMQKFKKWLQVSVVILMLTGSGFLVNIGHLGAQLVYQQAAGVYHPSEDCSEFIE